MIHPAPPRQVRSFSRKNPPRSRSSSTFHSESRGRSVVSWVRALGWMYAYILRPADPAWKARIWDGMWRDLQQLTLDDATARQLARVWPTWLCAYGWGVDPRYPVDRPRRLPDLYLYPTARWLVQIGDHLPALTIQWPDLGSTWPEAIPHPRTDQAWPLPVATGWHGSIPSVYWAQWIVDMGGVLPPAWEGIEVSPTKWWDVVYRRAALVDWMAHHPVAWDAPAGDSPE
jgi:hypothetical protein